MRLTRYVYNYKREREGERERMLTCIAFQEPQDRYQVEVDHAQDTRQ